MSIQPIDLQVLFARLNQVGREQAVQRDLLIQSQAVTASEIAEKSEEEDRRVSELTPQQEGPESVKDEGEGGHEGSAEERASEREETEEPPFFTDPDLGQNIDISG